MEDNEDILIEHSLWLMPFGGVEQMLADTIYDLSHRLASPAFPPHVTLIGDLISSSQELIRRSQEVARQLSPFRVELDSIDFQDAYFRSLYLLVRQSEQVMHANMVAREVFERTNGDAYMPHLSLLYGNFPLSAKKSIIEKLGSRLNCSFEVTRIYLCSTHGDPSSWQLLGDFPLNPPEE